MVMATMMALSIVMAEVTVKIQPPLFPKQGPLVQRLPLMGMLPFYLMLVLLLQLA
jgi:hypothetical protein